MSVKFIVNYPVAFIQEKKTLVLSDLHLGVEHELYKSGILISPQAERFAKTISKLIEYTSTRRLVLLGDVKHEVPGVSYREIKQIPKFFAGLPDVETIIVKGNHDTGLKDILPPRVKISPSKGLKLGKYGFFHGHAWPSKDLMECDYLFMAHIHPVIEFKDKFGYRATEQLWIKGRIDTKLVKRKYGIEKCGKLNIVIMPAFNKLLGGVVVNSDEGKELLGPVLRNRFVDVEECDAYLLDGTFLGRIKELKK